MTQFNQAYFGRIYSYDSRDEDYVLDLSTAAKRKSAFARVLQRKSIDDVVDYHTDEALQRGWRYWHSADVLNQKSTPQCVGYACYKFLTAGHIRNVDSIPTPKEIYDRAQQLDEWPGEDYDGTSIRGGMKALQRSGFIMRYYWLRDVESIANFILTEGPAIVGSIWTRDMSYACHTGEKGWAAPDGSTQGGHAYMLIGANKTKRVPGGGKGAFRILNSWGRGWCNSGRAWLSFDAMRRLLEMDCQVVGGIEVIEGEKHDNTTT